MRLRSPSWWYREAGALARLLAPIGRLYGAVAQARYRRVEPYRSRLPVICIGNFTVGGGGKTPTAISIAKALKGLGERPAFLTRGYGGASAGPHLVAETDSAAKVGDEPLLLAAEAPTMVAADRAAGARAIEALQAGGNAPSVIVMDDGFQNPQLRKDLSLIVVDSVLGIGNGLVMPAGPLRAPLDAQLEMADALVVIGDGGRAAALIDQFMGSGKTVLKASIVPRVDPRWLGVLPVIGFAGIASPEKFFATLRANGARLEATRSFADHHVFTDKEAAALLKEARREKCMLVTTEKDWVRLPDDASPRGELKFRSRPLLVAIEFAEPDALRGLLVDKLPRPGQLSGAISS